MAEMKDTKKDNTSAWAAQVSGNGKKTNPAIEDTVIENTVEEMPKDIESSTNDRNIAMPIEKAIEFVKTHDRAKFDSTIELHINLRISTNQTVRFTSTLPHGTGKEIKVAVMADEKVAEADLMLSEADIAKIESNDIKPGTDFGVLIVQPKYMAKIARVARILGPQGLMPNPKAGTVTENVAEAVTQFKSGRVEVRTEPNASIIHTIIGKKSFDDEALKDNFNVILTGLRQNKPQKAGTDWIKSVYLSASMSPSAEIELA